VSPYHVSRPYNDYLSIVSSTFDMGVPSNRPPFSTYSPQGLDSYPAASWVANSWPGTPVLVLPYANHAPTGAQPLAVSAVHLTGTSDLMATTNCNGGLPAGNICYVFIYSSNPTSASSGTVSFHSDSVYPVVSTSIINSSSGVPVSAGNPTLTLTQGTTTRISLSGITDQTAATPNYYFYFRVRNELGQLVDCHDYYDDVLDMGVSNEIMAGVWTAECTIPAGGAGSHTWTLENDYDANIVIPVVIQ
jgi:hypothetical protein